MLRIKQHLDNGPKDISDELFYKHCARLGRVIEDDEKYIWR